MQLVHCKATQEPCHPRSKLSCLQNQVATLHLKLLSQNNTHTSTIYSYSSYFYEQRSQSMAINHIETSVLLPDDKKVMTGGVHLKRPDRFSSCAGFELFSTPYLIKQASSFNATGSRVPREFVTVKKGEKTIQGPSNSWQLNAHDRIRQCLSSTSSPGPSHFLKEKPWGLGPRLCLSFLAIASTAYRKLN